LNAIERFPSQKLDLPRVITEHFRGSRHCSQPEDLAFDGKSPTLVVVEQDALFAELLSGNPVFRQKERISYFSECSSKDAASGISSG